MSDQRKRGARDARKTPSTTSDDVMHGRDLAGAEYGANEAEQTRERQRAGRDRTDEAGEATVTDAELEARDEENT